MRIQQRQKMIISGIFIASAIMSLSLISVKQSSAQVVWETCTNFTINIIPMQSNDLKHDTQPTRNPDGTYNLIRSTSNRIYVTGVPANCTRALRSIMITANTKTGTENEISTPFVMISYKYYAGAYNSWYTDYNTNLWTKSDIIFRATLTDGNTGAVIKNIDSTLYIFSDTPTIPPTTWGDPNTPPPVVTNPTIKPQTTDNKTATIGTTPAVTVVPVTSATTQLNTADHSCVENIITKDRYGAIKTGTSRLTSTELGLIRSCLETTKYIIPTALSPVDPEKVRSLETEKTITVNKPKNNTKKDAQGNKKEVLKISGKAKPNSVVVLYVFSDPLVITTSTDSNGDWQYTLEDPLKPGAHEVYAVVDKGDGSYKKSDPMSFIISTAGASAVNPDGLSLNLADSPTGTPAQSTRSLFFYIASSATILVLVLAGWYFALKIRKKKTDQPAYAAAGLPSIGSNKSEEFHSDLDGIDDTSAVGTEEDKEAKSDRV